MSRYVMAAAWAVGMFVLLYEAFWRPALQGFAKITEVIGP